MLAGQVKSARGAKRRIGLISDTHGLLRPEVLEFLRGSDRIIHAGDICEPEVLAALTELAPLTVVRGNNDRGGWAAALHEVERIRVEGVEVLVVHDLAAMGAAPAGVDVVVSGHTHKPRIEQRGGTLFVNPGSAGPRRFSLPISAGELIVEDGRASARLVEFSAPADRRLLAKPSLKALLLSDEACTDLLAPSRGAALED